MYLGAKYNLFRARDVDDDDNDDDDNDDDDEDIELYRYNSLILAYIR